MIRRPSTILAGVLLLAACGGADASTAPSAAEATPAPSVAASDAGGGTGACATTTDAGTVTVEIRQRAFIPGRIEASAGDVITFENADAVPHTATLDDGSCSTENLGQGDSGSLTFDAPGEYPFFCRVHPDMTGTIVVG